MSTTIIENLYLWNALLFSVHYTHAFLHVVALVIFLQLAPVDIKSPAIYCWQRTLEEMTVPKSLVYNILESVLSACFLLTFLYSTFLQICLFLFNDLGSCP